MLDAIRAAAEGFARQAGALLQEHAARLTHFDTKTSAINIVTEADRATEAYLVKAIREAFPDHYIHGEEGGGYGSPVGAPYRWLVDPLDGTVNYSHHFPVYAVNLGVMDADGELVVGVTYDPNRDELFGATRGQGATLNGQPLHVTAHETLVGSLLCSGFPYDAHTAADNNLAAWGAFVKQAQSVRRTGSAALDIAYVACGRLDGYWERGIEAWDIAPGILLVREAGGRATTYSGSEEGLPYGHEILATNGLLHDQMVATLAEVQA